MLVLKGRNLIKTNNKMNINIYRELFGIHPAGINFELYDDIPVEASHMEHSPVDSVCIFLRISFCKLFFFA
jgi:hypothetical protein